MAAEIMMGSDVSEALRLTYCKIIDVIIDERSASWVRENDGEDIDAVGTFCVTLSVLDPSLR